jgi:hypothetical protein
VNVRQSYDFHTGSRPPCLCFFMAAIIAPFLAGSMEIAGLPSRRPV